jgi:thymidylate kinase
MNDDPGALLLKIVSAVGKGNICILHGYETYPGIISSDVDVIVSPRGLRIICQTAFHGWRLVQCLRHEYSAYYFVYASVGSTQPKFLTLDASLDCRKDGCVFYEYREILALIQVNRNDLPVPPPDIEFGYYVTKRIGKAEIDVHQAARLSELWRNHPMACRRQLARFLPNEAVELIAAAADSGDWSGVSRDIRGLRGLMWKNMLFRRPAAYFAYYILDVVRAFGRLSKPTGIVVCLLGPDGAGKSTLMDVLAQWLAGVFRGVTCYHLRPRFGCAVQKKVVINPHGNPPRGLIFSLAKFALWITDGSLGFVLVIWPQKVCSRLILFDRYFHDLLVDPRRYRYEGPIWLARLVTLCVIKPDIFFVLDAPFTTLRSRKQEVSQDECERQRRGYLNLAGGLPNAHLIDASRPPEQVANQAATVILDHLAQITSRRLPYSGSGRTDRSEKGGE